MMCKSSIPRPRHWFVCSLDRTYRLWNSVHICTAHWDRHHSHMVGGFSTILCWSVGTHTQKCRKFYHILYTGYLFPGWVYKSEHTEAQSHCPAGKLNTLPNWGIISNRLFILDAARAEKYVNLDQIPYWISFVKQYAKVISVFFSWFWPISFHLFYHSPTVPLNKSP